MAFRFSLALVLLFIPQLTAAQGCTATVNSQTIVIAPDVLPEASEPGLRERAAGWPRRVWNSAWGTPSPCDSGTLIAFLSGIEGLTEEDSEALCLAPLPEDDGYLLVPGPRNWRGRCTRTACQRVNLAAKDAQAVAGIVTNMVTDEIGADPREDGLMAFAHASGAMMVSGSGGLILDTLGKTAAGMGAALSAPVVAGTAAATVLAAGGAVYLCSE